MSSWLEVMITRAREPGELQAEDRDSARPFEEHCLARPQRVDTLEECVPRRERGAREGRRFGIGQVVRRSDDAPFG